MRRPLRAGRLLRATGPGFLYLALFALLAAPALAMFRTHFMADSYDGVQNVWNLWWVHAAVREGRNPWFTPYLFHPDGVTLVGHTLNPFNGFLSFPFAPLLGPVATFNAVVVFAFVASGWTAFALAREIGGRTAPALFAGAAFTFGHYHWAHAQGHLQLVSIEWVPLFLLAWVRWLHGGGVRRGAFAAAALFLVFLCDYYYAFYCVLAGGLLLVSEARRRGPFFFARGVHGSGLLAFTALSLTTSGALAGALVAAQYRDPFEGFHHPYDGSLDLFALFIPGEHWRFGQLTRAYWAPLPGGGVEASVYLGWTVILAAAFSFVGDAAPARPRARWWVLAVVFFVLALGPRLHVLGERYDSIPLPYAALETLVPFLQLSGVPVRMSCMTLLAVCVLAACGLPELVRHVLRTRAAVVAYLAVFLVEIWPAPVPLTPLEMPDYVHALARLPPGAVHLPAGNGAQELLQQTVFEKPMTDGYISRTPSSLAARRAEIDALLAAGRHDDVVRRYRLRYLVLPNDGQELEVQGLSRVFDGEELSIYAVPSPAGPPDP